MTEPFDEYGDRLRRALHAEAGAVVPSPEGLEQIRTKIGERADRRFVTWLAAPWLRPLAAAAAAACLAIVAVSATPALKTFVQTGHFNSGTRHDGGTTGIDGKYTGGAVVPPGSPRPGPVAPPRPAAVASTTPGAHVVTGHKCPAGETPVGTPGTGGTGTARVAPKPRLTCASAPSAPTSPTQVATTPATSPTDTPPTNPATGADGGTQPSAQSSP